MINLNVETTINGRLLKPDSRLNALITDYILNNIGIVPAEEKIKVNGLRKPFLRWDEDETLRFAQEVEALVAGGTKERQICFALSEKYQHRSPGSLYQKIVELKKKGLIKYK